MVHIFLFEFPAYQSSLLYLSPEWHTDWATEHKP